MVETQLLLNKDVEIFQNKLDESEIFFRQITARYYNDILRICICRLGRREEAEDAAQEIFLRVYRSINSYDHNKSFWNWIYTITINHLKTHFSSLKRLIELKERARQNIESSTQDPTDFLEQRETCKKISQAIDSLPQQFKKVIILFYMENMRVTEISESLDISRENVKIQLYRARNLLKETLKEYYTVTP
jgi:RNA polymerase sigma-70 factor (ECF subfamily)